MANIRDLLHIPHPDTVRTRLRLSRFRSHGIVGLEVREGRSRP